MKSVSSVFRSFLMPQQALSAVLETMINQALAMNMNNNSQLTLLFDKCLTINLAELGFPLCFHIVDNYQTFEAPVSILVNGNAEHSDCTIDTSLKTLWQLKQDQQLTELIKQDKLNLQGDMKIAQQFLAFFEQLTIDWPSELAKHIGDVPTYKLLQLGNVLKQKLTFAQQQIQADSSEWLLHEQQLLVTDSELISFSNAVDSTVKDLAVLEQRITMISSKIISSKINS